MKSSGEHRKIRTKSGHYRLAGLCTQCAGNHDDERRTRSWIAVAGLFTLAIGSGLAVYEMFVAH
jgi:hypothetical protein